MVWWKNVIHSVPIKTKNNSHTKSAATISALHASNNVFSTLKATSCLYPIDSGIIFYIIKYIFEQRYIL